ncbi:MAG: hypothetical protein ACYC3S_13255 [Chloroflexota bacterium]
MVIEHRKRYRATAEEMAERQKAKLEREKALLKAAIERAKLETELKRLQGGEEESGKNNLALDIDDLPAIKRKLRKVGLDVTSTAEGVPTDDDEGLTGIAKAAMREFGHGIGLAMRETVIGRMQGVPMAGVNGPAVGTTAVAAINTPSQPAQAYEGPSVSVESEGSAGESSAVDASARSDSQRLIAILDGKSPEEAAAWLTGQEAPLLRQLVMLLRNTNDQQLPDLMDDLPRRAPQLAGFVEWLRQRPAWTLAAVKAVRGSSETVPSVSVMGL